ncbi:MAG TPA: methyltransferase domain-containing protein [Candidatus Saccharimonadales bacterium]|nr:methyltransferase domain-containing protein [Candidatus Saccharimonadales bacterium]
MMNLQRSYSELSPLRWDIRCLDQNPQLRSKKFPLSAKQASRIYPTRILRYWFIYHFLRIERQRQAAPLSICEIGIDAGQMLRFMGSVAETPGISPVQISSWVGVDCCVKHEALAGLGYTRCIEADIERSEEWLSSDYDALIVLHVMEHLYEPEKVFAKIASRMKPNSVIVGGFPSVPHWCVKLREPGLRANPDPGSHRCAFSPKRVRDIAQAQGLRLEFLAGAFFLRASGFFLEDYAWWLRFNLLFGALIPSWPGEIYWVMRKPALPTSGP